MLETDSVLETEHAGNAFYGTPDERASSLGTTLASDWRCYPPPKRVLVSNVGGDAVQNILNAWVKQNWQIVPEFVSSQSRGWGVVNAYERSTDLGVDRWVALVAAYNDTKGACCIIDGGTAVTIDGVTKQGRHIGGVIMPGLALMRRSLVKNTSRIRAAIGSCEPGIATDTGEAVASGTAFALLAGVERAVAVVKQELGTCATTLVTGGDAVFIGAAMSTDHKIDPDLVLKGLVIMASNEQ